MFYIITTLICPKNEQQRSSRTLWRLTGPITKKKDAESGLKKCGYAKSDVAPGVWKSCPDDDEYEFEATVIRSDRKITVEAHDVEQLIKQF